jgi:hypothetical protein
MFLVVTLEPSDSCDYDKLAMMMLIISALTDRYSVLLMVDS